MAAVGRWCGRGGTAELGRDRASGTARQRLPVEAPAIFGEVDVAAGDGEVTTAIAGLGAHRERGVEIARCLARRLTDQHALQPPVFEPDQGATVRIPGHVAEAGGGGEVARADGARPEAEGRRVHLLQFHQFDFDVVGAVDEDDAHPVFELDRSHPDIDAVRLDIGEGLVEVVGVEG